MPLPLGQHDHVAGGHRAGTVVQEQLPSTLGDELRLLDGIGMASKPLAWGNLEVDGCREAGAGAAIGEETARPADLVIVGCVEFGEIRLVMLIGSRVPSLVG
jgi:hypothetical protein